MVREGDLGRECRIECHKTKRCLISEGIGWGVSRFSLRCAYYFLFGRFRALAKQATHWCKDSSLPFAEGIQCVLASMVICFRANLSLHVARSSSCLRTNRRWILDFVVEGMSSTSSSQSPTSPGRESTSANDNARPHDPGTDSAGPARSRLSLQLDQRSLHFSVNAWVLIVALIGILPVASRQLQYKGYRLSLLGTTCTTGYALFAFYGLPRAGSTQAVQVWCHHVTSSKDFIPFMYCLMFVTSKLHLKLVLVPVICWALEHVSRFLRRHFTNSSLYRAYLEQLCTWVETNITAVNFLTANAEILLGFLLILSLFSRQRNVMQTFMYWQLLKLMYHSPYTAGYHRAIWLKIGRTVNPYIHRYTPFLHDPINAGMRWWFR